VRIAVNLNNGISIARLGDGAIKEKRRTRFGYTYISKEVATNYYYLLEPGVDFSFKLFSFNHIPDIWVTAKTKYRFLFGDSKYATTKQFSDYLFGIGISLIGYTFETAIPQNKPKQIKHCNVFSITIALPTIIGLAKVGVTNMADQHQ